MSTPLALLLFFTALKTAQQHTHRAASYIALDGQPGQAAPLLSCFMHTELQLLAHGPLHRLLLHNRGMLSTCCGSSDSRKAVRCLERCCHDA